MQKLRDKRSLRVTGKPKNKTPSLMVIGETRSKDGRRRPHEGIEPSRESERGKSQWVVKGEPKPRSKMQKASQLEKDIFPKLIVVNL